MYQISKFYLPYTFSKVVTRGYAPAKGGSKSDKKTWDLGKRNATQKRDRVAFSFLPRMRAEPKPKEDTQTTVEQEAGGLWEGLQ